MGAEVVRGPPAEETVGRRQVEVIDLTEEAPEAEVVDLVTEEEAEEAEAEAGVVGSRGGSGVRVGGVAGAHVAKDVPRTSRGKRQREVQHSLDDLHRDVLRQILRRLSPKDLYASATAASPELARVAEEFGLFRDLEAEAVRNVRPRGCRWGAGNATDAFLTWRERLEGGGATAPRFPQRGHYHYRWACRGCGDLGTVDVKRAFHRQALFHHPDSVVCRLCEACTSRNYDHRMWDAIRDAYGEHCVK